MLPHFVLGLLVLTALIFYQLRHTDTVVLLAIVIISIWGYYGWNIWKNQHDISSQQSTEELEKILHIPKELEQKNLQTNIVDLQFLPKQSTKYLKRNPLLIDILKDIRFIKMFDKARYYQLVLTMDRYQKTYIYMLIRRYRIQDTMQTFYDLQDLILEHMYSFIVISPVKLRHTYGLTPHERIHIQIEQFMKVSKTMVDVLRNFASLELKLPYFPEHVPKTYENDRKNVLP
jgi:hypothetical protein